MKLHICPILAGVWFAGATWTMVDHLQVMLEDWHESRYEIHPQITPHALELHPALLFWGDHFPPKGTCALPEGFKVCDI